MDPTLDFGTIAGKLLESTPMTALMGYALWKVVSYLKELIASHAAEIKAIQEKHDTERAASQALLLELTKEHITSSAALAKVVEQMGERLCEYGDKIDYIMATVVPPRPSKAQKALPASTT